MLERDLPTSRHKFLRVPQPERDLVKIPGPEKGIFKTGTEMVPDFMLKSAQVLPSQDGNLEIGPIMDSGTLAYNNSIVTEIHDPVLMHETREDYLSASLPRVRLTDDNRVEFVMRGRVLGGMNLKQGFWLSDKSSSILSVLGREIVRFDATKEDDERRALKVFQKHFTDPAEPEVAIYLLTTQFKTISDPEMFQDAIEEWRKNGSNPEDLKSIVSVEMNLKFQLDWKEDGGGSNISQDSPRSDDGGSGVKV